MNDMKWGFRIGMFAMIFSLLIVAGVLGGIGATGGFDKKDAWNQAIIKIY